MEGNFLEAPVEEGKEPRSVNISSDYLQAIYQRLSLATVLIPFVGTVLAVGLLPFAPIGLSEVVLFFVFYLSTMLGVEVGYHRYFAHRSFRTVKLIEAFLAILGSMAAQGGVIFWVAHHRRHHRYTEQENDPHSPHLHGSDLRGKVVGFWHAYMGWFLKGEVSNSAVFARDLLRDPLISSINRMQQVWVLLGLLLPALINGLITASWIGVLQGFLWGGLVRIFVGQQITNSTNSICHLFGSRPFISGEKSTNNFWLAIPSVGQSWHNNHHAFPNSAIAGLAWWQIDIGAGLIRFLERLGLVSEVKRPSPEIVASKARVLG